MITNKKLFIYKISNKLLAECLGYSDVKSFENSSAKKRIREGIEQLITHVEEQCIKKVTYALTTKLRAKLNEELLNTNTEELDK